MANAFKLCVLSALLSACGGSEADPCVPTANETLTDEAIVHACLHTTAGPFVEVNAAAAAANAEELRNLHTAYTLTLQPGTTGTYEGQVRFRPRASGVFAFHMSPAMPFVVRTADGASQCVLQTRSSASLCAGFAQSLTLRLKRQQDYVLLLGPSATAQAIVIPEEIWSDGEPL